VRALVCSLVFVFLIFFEQIFFVFGGIFFPLEDASQVRTQAGLTEHVQDVQQVGDIEELTIVPLVDPAHV
jgi:hypothetical protein